MADSVSTPPTHPTSKRDPSRLSVVAVAKRYGVTEETVLVWIRSGELQAVNVSRNPHSRRPRWLISQAALDAFELKRTNNPPTPPIARRKKPAGVVEFYPS